MLSAWFRIKYPHVVDGAIASSAPILLASGVEPNSSYYETVTKDASKTPNCTKNVRKGFNDILNLAS
jgi:lysosomal Pro-X carboxypeptidase